MRRMRVVDGESRLQCKGHGYPSHGFSVTSAEVSGQFRIADALVPAGDSRELNFPLLPHSGACNDLQRPAMTCNILG